MKRKEVSTALIDIYVVAENTQKLEGLEPQEIAENTFASGVVFQNHRLLKQIIPKMRLVILIK